MTSITSLITSLSRPAVAIALASALSFAHAAPGAHGPNGEHLDAPGATTSAAGTVPRFEAKSEDFELVGRLQGGELSMFINRYVTNEPVNNAKVEVELGNLKATAPFHADQGDYAVADAAFLKAVSEPGEHALVVTLIAGDDADLLEGSLNVEGVDEAHGHAHAGRVLKAVLAGLALLLAVGIGWLLGRKQGRRIHQETNTGSAR